MELQRKANCRMALAGKRQYPRPIYPKNSSQMPGPAPFMALASTGGRQNLAFWAPDFQECRPTDLYLCWWGRSYKSMNFADGEDLRTNFGASSKGTCLRFTYLFFSRQQANHMLKCQRSCSKIYIYIEHHICKLFYNTPDGFPVAI